MEQTLPKLKLSPLQHALLYACLMLGYLYSGSFFSGLSAQSQVVLIWLPAGIALFGVYLWSWRFLPAIFLASATFNLTAQDHLQLSLLLTPLGAEVGLIALGASLQAAVGGVILRRYIGDPLICTSSLKILLFIFVIGIGVNLISANIGVYALSTFNSNYSNEHHWLNVLNWWLGDSLGVLLATPVLFALYHLGFLPKGNKKSHWLIVATVSIALFSVTFTTVIFHKNSELNSLKLSQRETKVIENAIYRQLNNSLVHIHSLASFIQNTPNLTTDKFDSYVAQLIADEPSIKAMSWNTINDKDSLLNLQARLFEHYQRPISIQGTPLSKSDPYIVVEMISPLLGNEKALGFNVNSNPKRNTVLTQAEKANTPQATSIIQLVQSDYPEAGFLLFSPVYQLTRNATNKKQLIGYATGVFLVKELLSKAITPYQEDMFHLELYEPGTNRAFYDSFDELQKTNVQNLQLLGKENVTSLTFNFSGQTWLMNLQPKNDYLAHHPNDLSILLICFQVLIVAFIILLILLMNNRQTILNHLVSVRTKDLKREKQLSEQANKAKSRFLANMSHEIRTPLNAVIGFSQLAKQTKDTDTIVDYIDKIALSSSSLLNIVNDILDISKIESDKLQLENIPFDLLGILQRVDAMFSPLVQNKGLQWNLNNSLPQPTWYLGDPVRIEQILINLCSNAIKFTQSGSVTLTAQVLSQSSTEHTLSLAVIDTGVGIKPEIAKTLFSAFTQADDSTSRRFGGTGLGLAISKELSLLMGGDVTLTSDEGLGSTFTFRVTLTTTAPQATSQVEPDIDLSNIRILVAEDNPINQIVIQEMLRTLNIEAVLTKDGQEAIDTLQQQHFDLILMDCQMPALDGYEATKQIRTLPEFQHIPIIALTADAMPEDKAHALDVGFNFHLAKPLDIKKLKLCLSQFKL
ncbi:hypothetical protein PULV_a2427 [Pseudoalteromonas ulvae UL12]|nr:hypothetical protein [Pseudoalteromonas ulvae UL12]